MKHSVIKTIVTCTLAAAIILVPTEASAATPTAGISAILGKELQKNASASVASTGLSITAVGETLGTEALTEVSEPETEFTEALVLATEAEEESTETTVNETVHAGIIGSLDELLTAETAEAEVEEAVADEAIEETVTAEALEDAEASADAEAMEAGEAAETEEAETEVIETICGYTNLGITNITEGNLNIRTAPAEDAELAGKLPKDAACEILSEENGWAAITSGEVEGYVKSEYLLTGEEARAKAEELKTLTATVTADVLNVREEANTESEIVDQIANGEEIPVLEELGEWLKVDVDGEERYVNAEFVTVAETLKDALTLSEARYGEGVSDVRVAVVDYATQFVGNPYVWGGTSLTNGADCSGFVMSIMANYGVYLPHSSAAQAGYGTRVSASELLPGDLIFYGSGSRIGHVAIYIGNGQICHASNRRTGITISNMYYRSPICCTRVLN